jgi:hypothetical protein
MRATGSTLWVSAVASNCLEGPGEHIPSVLAMLNCRVLYVSAPYQRYVSPAMATRCLEGPGEGDALLQTGSASH